MDEGKQPLGEAEQEQIQQKRAVEQAEDQTGQTPASRTNITEDPSESELDPRFDRDDLRQGKPPPAVKKRHLPRKIKIRRPRAKKGTPLSPKGEGAAAEKTAEAEVDEADMTEEEVEVEGEGDDDDADNDGKDEEEGKKKSLFKKILGSNSTT